MGNNVDRKKKPFYKGKRPICPFCGAEMEIVRYIGYNESFNYWSYWIRWFLVNIMVKQPWCKCYRILFKSTNQSGTF